KRIVTVIASDESVDRDGDIIRQSGWEGLKTWGESGAVLWSHNYSLQAVGVPHKAWVDKDKKRLMAELSFPEEYGKAYPASEAVYQGLKAGAIPAVSVGFNPVETLNPSEEERGKLGLGPYGVVFQKQELFEISPCNVASNRNALVQQVKAAGIDTQSLEEMLQHEDNFVIEVSSDEPEYACDMCQDKGYFIPINMAKDPPEPGEKFDCPCKGYDDDDYDDDIVFIKADDFDTMKLYLEDEGYAVTKSDAGTETLTVVIEEPMTVELDLPPEPEMDEEALDQLALEVAESLLKLYAEKVRDRASRAAKRVLDYHLGKVVED
ncbi:hypothetical protein LCGC14_2792590, partial [marine sediment metagenome]